MILKETVGINIILMIDAAVNTTTKPVLVDYVAQRMGIVVNQMTTVVEAVNQNLANVRQSLEPLPKLLLQALLLHQQVYLVV
jgi:hypothetical protein